MTQHYEFDPDLKCCWGSWRIVEPGHLALYIKAPNSTDMTGAIKVGKRLMPDVCAIMVFSGDDLDIVYRREGEGKSWRAIDTRGQGFTCYNFTQPQG